MVEPRRTVFHRLGDALKRLSGRGKPVEPVATPPKEQPRKRMFREGVAKRTFRQFLEEVKALAHDSAGDHMHVIEFEPQRGGILGRYRLVHENDLGAGVRNDLDDAAFGAGMHGFREVHHPGGDRNGSMTIVFDATNRDEIIRHFLAVHGGNVILKEADGQPSRLTAKYHSA